MSSSDHPQKSSDTSKRRIAMISGQLAAPLNKSIATIRNAPPLRPARPNAKNEWSHLPKYKDLPKEGGYRHAWKVWGEGDSLGTVNLLTDACIRQSAVEEIRTGHCISLNWAMHLPLEPFFNRHSLDHKLIAKKGAWYGQTRDAANKYAREVKKVEVEDRQEKGQDLSGKDNPVPVSDDMIIMNTQSGTQWDSFRHFGHIGLNCFYQGVPRSIIQDHFESHQETMKNASPNPLTAPPSERERNQLGIQNWANHGICGRAVLLDVYGYLSRKLSHRDQRSRPYDPMSSFAITLETLKEVARAQGVHFRKGDILLIRSGFIHRYQNSTASERRAWMKRPVGQFAGVEQGEHVLEWLWDHHFGAVASDSPTFEVWGQQVENGKGLLHEGLLALLGFPIGEMFDLEAVTKYAIANRRWTFHFTSFPLNLHGGAASPANAAAFF